MDRFVSRTTRWLAALVFISPAAIGLADSPKPAAENVDLPAGDSPAESPAHKDSKEGPLFRHASYPAAWTAAQQSNRPILVYVSMPQCPHCSEMIDKSYGSDEVKELVTDSFETLQVGRYTHPTLISKLHVRWYPTTVLVGSNNKVLDVIEGYVDAKTLKRRLQLGIASAGTGAAVLK